MIIIDINNSYSRIRGLTADQFKQLRKILSYSTDPAASYYSGGFTRVKYLLDKHGNFPTGLVDRVIAHAIKEGYYYSLHAHDLRQAPKPLATPFKPSFKDKPYPDQLLAKERAYSAHRGGIVMPTGTGKSMVIGLIIARLNVKTLVIVPTLEIKKQLTESIQEWFGTTPNIVIENIDSNSLKTLTDFDCLIIDECHHAAAKTYQNLNKTVWSKIYYRFFLTATFFRNQTNEQLLFEGIAGQEIYRLSYKEAITKGYIVPIEAYYIDLPKRITDLYTWREVYNDLIINNEARNELIGRLLRVLNTGGHFTLCLVKEIAHGSHIMDMCDAPFANGQDDICREFIKHFNQGRIKTLIGTTGILGEGVDTKPCEYVIIAGLGKAKSAFMQQIGRAVRRYPGKESAKVIIFRDSSHKWTKNHFQAQRKILIEEYGVVPIKLDII